MSKGDAVTVAKQQHGVQYKPDPPNPQTIEQRVAKLEAQISGRALLEKVLPSPTVDETLQKGN